MTHSDQITQIDTVRAYHSGPVSSLLSLSCSLSAF